MVDHLAWAQGYRERAAKCLLAAKNTTSAKFGECYELLAQHYALLANLEELSAPADSVASQIANDCRNFADRPALPLRARCAAAPASATE